jgi:hypothetical protein
MECERIAHPSCENLVDTSAYLIVTYNRIPCASIIGTVFAFINSSKVTHPDRR